jgi:hypothetical protein
LEHVIKIKNIRKHFFNGKLFCTFGVYNKKGTKLSMKHFLNIATDFTLRKEDSLLEDRFKYQRK